MRARRNTVREGSSKTVSDSAVMERVRLLHVALKTRGAKSPGIAALMAYHSLVNHPETSHFGRWVYLLRTTKLEPQVLNVALHEAGYKGAHSE